MRRNTSRPRSTTCAGDASLYAALIRALSLLALALCAAPAFSAAPAGAWWNTAYSQRFSVEIATGGSALAAGYSIAVDLDHAALTAAGLSLANGDDIRVVHWNGAAWVELDRVLDVQSAWNTASTRLWFATQSGVGANAVDDDYYIYYANPGAGAPPQDADQVFLLYDAFDGAGVSAARWSAGGAPSVSGGVVTLSPGDSLRSQAAFPTNTIWEARIQMPENLPSGGSHYFHYWLGATGTDFTSGDFAGFYADVSDHYAVVRDNSTTLSNINQGSPTGWQTYSFFRNGGSNVRYWIDGGLVRTLSSNIPTSSLRVYVVNNANGSRTQNYDWVRVRRYVANPPTIALASPEQYALIAHWRMEQPAWSGASGEALDSGPYGLNLTSAGGAQTANASPAIPGNPGTCRYGAFDGANDYLQAADNARLEPDTRLSVAVWIYPRSRPASGALKSIVSKDTTYEFHINSSGQINWWWGGGAQELTTNAAVPLNQWSHVAITYQPGEQRIYINGVLRASRSTPGTLATNNLPFQIGQDQNFAGRFWDGYIDEVALYNRALSAAEVASLMNATYPCTGAAPKLVVQHDGYGVHCLAEAVTIEVRDAANNPHTSYTESVTLTTSTGRGTWSLLSGAGVFNDGAANDGVATYQWPSGQSSAVFGLYYPDGAPVVDVDARQTNDPAVGDDDTEGLLSFAPSGFTVTSMALANPVTGVPPPFASPQTAGVDFDVHIAAYGQTPEDPTCGVIESYNGAKPIKFWSTYVNPASGFRQVTIDGAAIATTSAGAAAQTVDFVNGQARVTAKYKDAGAISINLRDDNTPPAAVSGGTGVVVVRPATFTLSNIARTSDGAVNPAAANASGPVFIAAGAAFTATVAARDAEGDPVWNYGRETPAESAALTPTLLAPVGGVAGAIAAPGGFGAFNQGVASGADFSWNEVGIISLAAHVGDGDYLGAGDVVGASTGPVGRFVPARFDVSANTPLFQTACPAGAFTYIGQPFTYAVAPVLTVTALSTAGLLTQNYRDDFFKLTHASLNNRAYEGGGAALDASGLPAAPGDLLIAPGAGSGTLTFEDGAGLAVARTAPQAPFDAQISLRIDVTDADGVSYAGPLGARYVIGTAGGIAFTSGSQQRYGRIAFRNAVGSELIDLPVPLRAEYFVSDAAGFALNNVDACTSGVTLSLGSYVGNLQAGETCAADSGSPGASGIGCPASAAQPFREPPLNGDFNLRLRAPGANNDGAVTVQSVVPPWLQFDWDASTPAEENPSGVAAFGVFQGHSKRIYQRERVR